MLYIIEIEPPLAGRARYYLGWAKDVNRRFAHHCNGSGANLTRVAVQRGHTLKLVAIHPGDKNDERRYKNRKNHAAVLRAWKKEGK